MAKKVVEIEIDVNSQQVGTATDKINGLNKSIKDTGLTTQDFGSKVKIEYNKVGEATDVLVNSELTLKKQIRAVYDQMQLLTAGGKAQSQEFTILQRKYNDLNDNLSKNKARSQELFGTLSLLPGPVGAFASSLQGSVDLLKTFSGVKLTDLKNQFVGLKNDIKEVFQSFGGYDKAKEAIDAKYAKPVSTVNNATNIGSSGADTTATNTNTGAEIANTEETLRNAAAQKESSDEKLVDAQSTKIDTLETDKLTLATIENNLATQQIILTAQKEKIAKLNAAVANGEYVSTLQFEKIAEEQSLRAAIVSNLETQKGIYVTKIATAATEGQTGAIEGQTVALTAEQIAAKEAELASARLAATWKGIASATGIGLLIVLLVQLVQTFGDYISGAQEAEIATKRFNDQLNISKKYLEIDLETTKNVGDTKIGYLKKNNADAKTIRDLEAKELEAQLTLISNAQIDAAKLQNDAVKQYEEVSKKIFSNDLKDAAGENIKKADERIIELQKQFGQTSQQIRVKMYDNMLQNDKENSDRRLKDLDILIKQESEKRDTDKKKLQNYLSEKAQIEAYWGHYTAKQKEDLKKEDDKKVNAAIVEDKVRVLEGQKDLQNLILATAKQGSEEYFNAKLSVAKIEYQKDKEAALLAGADKENKLIEAQVAFNGKIHSLDEEKIKQNEDSLNKLGQISIAAIKDDTDRQVAARQEKYNTDLRELEKEMALIKMSEESKAFYRSELREALDNDIEKIHIDELVKKYQSELTLLEAQQKNLVAGTKAFLDNSIAIEEEAYQIKLLNAQKNGEDKERIEKEHAENIKAINLAAFEAEKNLQIQRLGVIAGIGQSLQTLAGKNKKIAIAGIIIEKAASIGQIIANTGIANAKAVSVSPLTFGQPWVAINTIAAGLSIAASIKGAADAISQINSSDSGSSGGASTTPAAPNANYGKNYGDGGLLDGPRHAQGGVMINAEGGEAVMTRGAVTMFAPMLSMMNQMGGGTSFSKGAAGQSRFDNPKISNTSVAQPQIIKTYVVSSDLTTDQQKQARLKDLSTL
jgi:hypothetical protein